MSWEKLVEKAEKDHETTLALLAELSEKFRHWLNVALGIAGLFLGVMALGWQHPVVVAVFGLMFLASFLKAWSWSKKLKKVEEYISGDPVMSIRETISKYSDEIVYTMIGAGLFLLGLLHMLGLIP